MKKEEKCGETCSHSHEKERQMLELNVLDMQLRHLEQQAMLVEQQVQEQTAINIDLEEMKKAKKGQSALFPFSRDIFIEAKIEGSDVFVNVGSKTFAKKSIDGAKEIMNKQKNRLLAANEEIAREIEKITVRISEIEREIRG